MNKLNFGIISPGKHFSKNIMPALANISNIKIYSIYSRKKKYKHIKKIKIYNNINNFLNDKNIDIVYICSPNSFHFNHALISLKNNKHVICEKPLVVSQLDFKKLLKTSKENKKFIFEGFMFQYHQQFRILEKLIKNKKIGKIISINSSFCYPHKKKTDIRYNKKLGGGAFLDVGCYLFKLSSLIFKKKLFKIILEKYPSRKYNVDTYGNCQLFYSNGSIANLEWGIGYKYINQLQIITNSSSLLLERIFSKNCKDDYFIRISKGNKKEKTIRIKKMNHFTEMFKKFCTIIQNYNFYEYAKYLKELKLYQNIYLKVYSKYYEY